VGVVADL
jgi:U3 small nucleolar RNA-associated protein 18